ncbi:hypothetical protein PG984_010363 [Apiospora sp. TS-2023a]
MDTDSEIYLGFWTNWSKGSAVLGSTLTMTRENGNFLIAFTALFVPFVASRFWRMSALIFHQRYSTSNSPDGKNSGDVIHHQRQILLRNASSPESALMSFFGLMMTWRRAEKRSWLRLLPVTLFISCSIVTFTVAGGFSSQISSAGDVLLKGSNCQIATNYGYGNSQANYLRSYWTRFFNNVANYAKNCYTDQGSGLLECSRFVTRTLPTASTNYQAPCPFTSGICRRTNSTIRLDTGHLNSNTLFGMNARQEDTFTWRYVLQVSYCLNSSCGEECFLTRLHRFYQTLALINETETWRYSSFQVMELDSNRQPKTTVPEDIYRPDEAASPLGCLEQFQWCRDPDLGHCGTLDSSWNAIYSAAPWFDLTSEDVDNHFANAGKSIPQTRHGSLLLWTYLTLGSSGGLASLTENLGPGTLASQTLLSEGFIVDVPQNQWQIDVTQWWHTMLASVQARFVNTAHGGIDSGLPPVTYKPTTSFEWDFCRNQKIRSAQYASFSVLGLVLTYLLGAIVIIVSFVIEPILRYLQRHGRYSKEAFLQWEQDSAIHLHRAVQNRPNQGHCSHDKKSSDQRALQEGPLEHSSGGSTERTDVEAQSEPLAGYKYAIKGGQVDAIDGAREKVQGRPQTAP